MVIYWFAMPSALLVFSNVEKKNGEGRNKKVK